MTDLTGNRSAPILRTRFVNEFFGPCYDNLEKLSLSMHELGFIYAVFAIGESLHSFRATLLVAF